MPFNYSKSWEKLNSLEETFSKIDSLKTILYFALISLENKEYKDSKNLVVCSQKILEYFSEEFDKKFKEVWEEIITNNLETQNESSDTISFPDLSSTLGDWYYYENHDTITNPQSYTAKIELDGLTGECYIKIPDELLEILNWNEGDNIEFIKNYDNSVTMKKVNEI